MIGDKIYQLRKSKNLSQEEFANSIGVTRQIVSKWESNQSIPLVDKLKKISDVYEIPYDELLKGTKYADKKRNTIIKYVGLFLLMILSQVGFILLVSVFSNKSTENEYRCLGTQTYEVLKVYASEDENFAYLTLKKEDEIQTVKVPRVISQLVREGNMYKFIFRSSTDNDTTESVFRDGDIINVVETSISENIIRCK